MSSKNVRLGEDRVLFEARDRRRPVERGVRWPSGRQGSHTDICEQVRGVPILVLLSDVNTQVCEGLLSIFVTES